MILRRRRKEKSRGSSQSSSDGLRVTRVGIGYLVLAAVTLVAASNTGNNGLYLVVAAMAGTLLGSHLLGSWNVRDLDLEIAPPEELFAGSPSQLHLQVRNPSRLLARWGLVVTLDQGEADSEGKEAGEETHRTLTQVLFHLPRRSHRQVILELLMRRRGKRKIRHVHIASLFPLGLFRKGRKSPVELELLVYPEIYPPPSVQPEQRSKLGEHETPKPGRGHELLDLRLFRHGDDPRGIHWKQSARTGQLIYKERESEESRRLSILFDNAVGSMASAAERGRFERLVSEAATAALDFLGQGLEVELRTRDKSLPFAAGSRQRRRILETLALIQARPKEVVPLSPSDPTVPHLRVAMEQPEEREGAVA